MIQHLFSQNIFTYVIIGLLVIGLIVRIFMAYIYKRLLKHSKKMGTSTNRLMKIIRIKYETCYKLQLGVNNVDIFVDKYVYSHKICGLYLYTWETICGLLVIVELLISCVAGGLGVVYKCGQNRVLSTFAVGVISTALLLIVDYIINIHTKKKILRINIKDYLMNYLKVKLENPKVCSEVMEQYRKGNGELSGKKKKQTTNEMGVAEEESAVTKMQYSDPVARREAKKNELRKMIQEDKKERREKELERKQQLEEKMIEPEREESLEQENSLQLSDEEEKVIKEILKEYLA